MRQLPLTVLFTLPLANTPCLAQPKVECAVTRYDYGVRLPGPMPSAAFAVTNRGQDPLTLRPQLCCGLTLSGVEKPIAPGETRRLVALATHPLGDGEFRKTMRLFTNDPGCPELDLEVVAMGKSPLQVFPAEELTFSIVAEEVPPQIVLLRTNYDPELKITSIRCSAPYVHCQEVKPDVPDGDTPERYKAIRITIGANAPSTPYEAVIAVGTTCKQHPEVILRVYGLSPTAVAAQPPRLDFEPLQKSEPIASHVIVLTRSMGPFKVLGVMTSDPRMKVKVEPDASGMFAELVATFAPGDKRGPFRGTITVKTDDPERPRLVIPYSGEAEG
jgi:hypothetical protein